MVAGEHHVAAKVLVHFWRLVRSLQFLANAEVDQCKLNDSLFSLPRADFLEFKVAMGAKVEDIRAMETVEE